MKTKNGDELVLHFEQRESAMIEMLLDESQNDFCPCMDEDSEYCPCMDCNNEIGNELE